MLSHFSLLVDSNLIPNKNYGYSVDVKLLSHSLKAMRDKGQFVVFVPQALSKDAALQAVNYVIEQVNGKS